MNVDWDFSIPPGSASPSLPPVFFCRTGASFAVCLSELFLSLFKGTFTLEGSGFSLPFPLFGIEGIVLGAVTSFFLAPLTSFLKILDRTFGVVVLA